MPVATNAVFDRTVNDIEAAYDELGHELAWRFLTVSKSVLNSQPLFALITANPGGTRIPGNEEGKASCESGCAYRVETWGSSPGQHNLQRQVKGLFDAIAAETGDPTQGHTLMETSLGAYFIPFRSPRLAKLHRPKESIAFAKSMWTDLLGRTRPRVIFTIDHTTFQNIAAILQEGLAGACVESRKMPTGWGNVTAEVRHFENGPERTTLVRLPHLSTFKLFSRVQCRAPVDKIIAEACRGVSTKVGA